MGCKASKETGSNGAPKRNQVKASATQAPEKLLARYDLGKVLGQGAFGVVFACTEKASQHEYAVKMIDLVETKLEIISREVAMLTKLKHPCIVRLHDVYYEKVFVCMVLDIYRGGDMIKGMQAHWQSKGPIPVGVVQSVTKQMLEGVNWLHQNGCVHRDVKGDNYMMEDPDIAKPKLRVFLSDFGTVCGIKAGQRLTDRCGTKIYWAPEQFEKNYARPVDVWALGVILYGLLTGRFPFSGETDVKNKQIETPRRAGKDGAELITGMLDRSETSRFSADACLRHAFLASTAPIANTELEQPDPNFKPELQEDGADAGVAERRRELVERLENAQKKNTGLKTPDQFANRNFGVTDKLRERTYFYEWWSPDKVKQKGLSDHTGISGAAKKTEGKNVMSVKALLEEHNISTAAFGTDKAKSLAEFALELEEGRSRLMLDATKHKHIVRVVDIVVLRVVYKDGPKPLFLVVNSEQFPDMRVRTGVDNLPGMKQESHENIVQTAKRIVKERLQMTDCGVSLDLERIERYEEDEESPSFPGVRSVYRKFIIEAAIKVTDARILRRVGLKPLQSWKCEDSKHYVRSLSWLTEEQTKAKKISLRAPEEGAELSPLVHAPIGYDEGDLAKFLAANQGAKFDEGGSGRMKDFKAELAKGEAMLVKEEGGKINRVVDVVTLHITNHKGEVLVEAEDVTAGIRRRLERLPAIKCRPDENQFMAAQRLLGKVLRVRLHGIALMPESVTISEESTMSTTYIGLPTVYRKRTISAKVVLKPEDVAY